jgi:hypothetical protein
MPELDAKGRQELAEGWKNKNAFYKNYAPVVEAAGQ